VGGKGFVWGEAVAKNPLSHPNLRRANGRMKL
jgi:hypothetical protein